MVIFFIDIERWYLPVVLVVQVVQVGLVVPKIENIK